MFISRWLRSMAHSSSGESCNSAPEVIDPFSPDNDKVQEPRLRCPLCLKPGVCFYCEKCVRNGSFTHSQDKSLERSSEKQLKLYKLKKRNEKLQRRYEDLLSTEIKLENLRLAVALSSKVNKDLKAGIKQVSSKIKSTQKKIDNFQRESSHWCNERSKLKEKISNTEEEIDSCRKNIKENELKLKELHESMKLVRQANIQQLVIYIFPISKVKAPKHSHEKYLDPDEHMEAIYVTGHWELAGDSRECDFQYSIIESCIPSNGNYSAYIDWTSKHTEDLPLTEEDKYLRDMASSIIAALSFTAHLVTVLCFYLDAHVPKRLTHSEFYGNNLDEQLFLHKVAKLNANVIYLCLSQNVDPAHIRPHHTIDNLLLLLDPSVSDLGRAGPMGVNQRLPSDVEDYLALELMPNSDDDDDGNNFEDLPQDWVEVNEPTEAEGVVICQFGTMTDQPQYGSQRPSLTGEIMSSVASLWKAATWQK